MKAVLIAQSSKWIIKNSTAYRDEIWEFVENSTSYQLPAIRNGFGGVFIQCNCKDNRCRHWRSVNDADSDRIAENNRTRKGGAFIGSDGMVEIDKGFYQVMGDVRNNRGRSR